MSIVIAENAVVVIATRDQDLAPMAHLFQDQFLQPADYKVMALLKDCDFSSPNAFGRWSDRVVFGLVAMVRPELDRNVPVIVVFDWRDHLRFVSPHLRQFGIHPVYLNVDGTLVDVRYE